jgi:CDP-6-deoxy-D-xylo-4-hexulose-3-dehydrase
MHEEKLRKEVLKRIRELVNLRDKKKKFIPKKTKINYAGRVYDEKEIMCLIDSSLDFWLTEGKYSDLFEEKFTRFLGSRYCILVNSGSSANLLAVTALTSEKLGDRKLSPGDEVVTLACGFPTTLNPIIQNNLIPVFIDIEKGSYNIKVSALKKAISNKTKAIFIPHTLGNPCNLLEISSIVKKHKIWFIEDNCDALGSKYCDKFTGTFGHISTYSFYPAHHITMGEGGALVTDDTTLYKIIFSLKNWGKDCWCKTGEDNACGKRFSQKIGELPFGYDHKYIYSHIGYNFKVTDMQAAIGVQQLKKLPDFIEKRKNNFNILYNFLIKYKEFIVLPEWDNKSEVSWFGFPILIKKEAPFKRNEIIDYLESNKIATRMLFGGNLLKHPAYRGIQYRVVGDLKNTDLVMSNLFWIGVYPGIDEDRLNYICNTFHNFFTNFVSL